MFRSTRRPIVFPQSEHCRMAAMLADHWGNDAFTRLPSHSDVVGAVATHDRGFGVFDRDEIGAMTDDRWRTIARAGFAMTTRNTVADHLVRLHVRRLVDDELLADELDGALSRSWRHSGCSVEECDAADRIMELCDWIAYEFCFERPASRTIAVRPALGAATVDITYVLDGHGEIEISPWPLNRERVEGCIFGYAAGDYSHAAAPVIVPFGAQRAA